MFYKHSGRFTLGGLLIGTITAGAGSLILAYIYARGIIVIPDAKLAAIATLAFGALIGVAAGYGLMFGKVRNEPVGLAVTGAVSALALYVSWAMWVSFVLKSQQVDEVRWTKLVQHPGALWDLMCLINRYGTWGLSSGSATNGWALWVIWILEAVFVIGAALFCGIGVLNHRLFCEACGLWGSRGAKLMLAPPSDVAQLKLQLEANDLRPLENLVPGNKAVDHLVVVLDSCEQCRQFHTMSLTHVTIRRTKTGKPNINNTVIARHMLIGAGQAEALRQLSEKVAQTAKIIPPKTNAAAAGK
jgi:hypothetical protein